MAQTDAPSQAAVSPLRQVLIYGAYWRWSIARQLARLPILMASLAFVLASTYATGELATGGLMVTALIMLSTFMAPLAARVTDRLGPFRGAELSLGLATLALSGLAAAVALKPPAMWLIVLAGLSGLLMAGQGGATRAILSSVVPGRLMHQALAVDSTILEILVVSAPLLAAAAAAVSPPLAIVAMAASQGLAALAVRSLASSIGTAQPINPVEAGPRVRGLNSLWRNPRFVFWMLMSVAFGHAIGTAETSVLPLATSLGGGLGSSATLIALEAGASALAGLAFATFSHKLSPNPLPKAGIMLGLMITACIVLAVSPNLIVVGATLIVLGACIAPFDIVRSVAAENVVPQERKTEAFGLIGATHALGFSMAGLFLAILPLKGMLMAGGVSGILALALAPVLMRER